ncbi:MAG: hypothetical protein PUD39_08455 [Bacteroidales bacterium]|nr:hypothetical protein [Bacteroidales bacterium]
MIKRTNDIADDEIRIIMACESSDPKATRTKKTKNRLVRVYLPIVALVILLVVIGWILLPAENDADEDLMTIAEDEIIVNQPVIKPDEPSVSVKEGIVVVDTVINKRGLLIIYPENLRPKLVIGRDMLNDSTIVLATQAADIRRDNGKIVGTFVMDGEVISKGDSKAGYCSIIGDEITIGVSDATPMLEQVLLQDGYFFRQYPLVVGGQIVENKPKGESIRKALAEIDGKICVVRSKEKLTFQDFSQLLVDAGVRNAVYLVGSSSYGFYINESGKKKLIGGAQKIEVENESYIVWEKH